MSIFWNVVQYIPGVSYVSSYFWQQETLSNSLETRVFHNILDYLYPSDIGRCSRVSQRWHWTTAQFPQRLAARMIQKTVYEVLMMGSKEQEENTDILCSALRKFLLCRKREFPLQVHPAPGFTSLITHDTAYVDMYRNFAQFLEKAKWNVRSLLEIPLTKVSATFTDRLVSLQCQQQISIEKRIYLQLKQSIASNRCFPGSKKWIDFQHLIDGLDCRILGEILTKAYESIDPQDNYCFIVLLKMAFLLPWELPPPELACKKTYLEKTIFLKGSDSSTFLETPRFLELILFRAYRGKNRILYEQIIDKFLFRKLLANSLKEIPPHIWKSKGKMILDFFETFPWNSFWEKVFESASDSFTQEIGLCFKRFFQKKASPQEKAECLNRLEELIPDSRYTFPYVFGQLHLPLIEENPIFFPSCVRPLNFHPNHPVIECGDICIGIIQGHNTTALCAYDKKDERLLWELHSIDLFPETTVWPNDLFYCRRSDSDLALLHGQSSQLLLINAADGRIKQSVAMPGSFHKNMGKKDSPPQLHFSSCGYVYYKTELNNTEVLLCGEIDTIWHTRFHMSIPLTLNGQEHFASFYEPLHFIWTIVDKSGATSFIPSCHDLRIKGNYMYTFNQAGQLTRHTLQRSKDKFLPYGPKQSILIRGRPYHCRILEICDDGTVICTAAQGYKTRFYFVDFDFRFKTWKTLKQQIASFNPDYFVDTKNGVLWTWDKEKNELWTHTASQSKKMDPLNYTGTLTFLSVDHKNRLLCVRD